MPITPPSLTPSQTLPIIAPTPSPTLPIIIPKPSPSPDADVSDHRPDAVPIREVDTISDAETVRVSGCDSYAETVRDRSRSAESWTNDLLQPRQPEARPPSPDLADEWWHGTFGGFASSSAGAVVSSRPPQDSVDHALPSISAVASDAVAESDADPSMRTSSPIPIPTPIPIPMPTPLFEQFLEEVRSDPIFDLSFLTPYGTPRDIAFDNSCRSIMAVRSTCRNPCCFKIGVACNIHYRFYNMLYGYHFWNYSSMAVLVQADPITCGKIETDLIAHFRGTLGCRM